jgi:hypothetical protein
LVGVGPGRIDALTCEKSFIAFTAKEGAGQHCEAAASSLFNQ